jgi:hypothetical protein
MLNPLDAQSFLGHHRRFSLVNHCYLETGIYHLLRILLKHVLRETNMNFVLATHPVEFQENVACYRVFIKHLVKSPKFEE